jgi:hypothetical protein
MGAQLQVPVMEIEQAGPDEISQYDYLVLGSSVYIGKTEHRLWLQKNADILRTKKLFHFIVCATPADQADKLQTIINNNIPTGLMQPASLWFLPGRMIMKDLKWWDRFLLRTGARLEKDPEVKKFMLTDFDRVNEKEIAPLVKAVQVYLGQGQNDSKKVQDAVTA